MLHHNRLYNRIHHSRYIITGCITPSTVYYNRLHHNRLCQYRLHHNRLCHNRLHHVS